MSENLDRKPVQISAKIVTKIDQLYGMEVLDNFSGFISSALELFLKKEEFLKNFAPHLKFIATDERGMLIRDKHLDNKVVEVTMRDGRLWCSECKPKTCMHVFYAMGRPEIADLPDLDGKKK